MKEVSEYSFPFDAEETSPGAFDRVYYAEDFARYLRPFFKSGVFQEASTSLQVIANGDMTVTLKPGNMNLDGYRYENTDDIIIQLSPPDGVLNRIDRIAITWMNEERDAYCTLREGEFSYEPVPPECRRNADYKDYVLADIYIQAGAISINQTDITDTRPDESICGYVGGIGGSGSGSGGAGNWEYDPETETLLVSGGVEYDPETETLLISGGVEYDPETEALLISGGGSFDGGSMDVKAIAERAAQIIKDGMEEITEEEVEEMFGSFTPGSGMEITDIAEQAAEIVKNNMQEISGAEVAELFK